MDLHAVAHRIEQLLEQLQASASARVWSQVEDLVRALTDLYGAGLVRTFELAGRRLPPGGAPDLLDELAGDELVAGLLLLHDIHPESLPVRSGRAIEEVRPVVVASGGQVRLVGVDAGLVRVALSVSATGCGSDPSSLAASVRESLVNALPDAAGIEVDLSVEAEADRSPVETPIRLTRKRAPAGAGP